MDNHGKKMIAPVVVVLCIMLYYAIGIYILFKFSLPNIVKIIAIIISILVTVVLIKVLAERVKEIKGGEEDDLGKY
jgi:Kef-type K+ transport system membrane component KefB